MVSRTTPPPVTWPAALTAACASGEPARSTRASTNAFAPAAFTRSAYDAGSTSRARARDRAEAGCRDGGQLEPSALVEAGVDQAGVEPDPPGGAVRGAAQLRGRLVVPGLAAAG